MSDPLTRLIDLPSACPDPVRAERIRARCRARLERRAPPARTRVQGTGARWVWQTLIVVLGVSYMTEVIAQALRVYGLY